MELCSLQVDFNYEARSRTRQLRNDGLIPDAGNFGEYGNPIENDEPTRNAAEWNSKLQEAIQRHDIGQLRLLLTSHEACETDAVDEHGIGAIHYAARHGFLEGMCLIVAYKSTIDLKTRCGSTALHIAIRYRENEIAKFLLEQGSNPNLADEMGLNALLLAVKKSLTGVVAKILETKAVDIDVQDSKLNSALHIAAITGDAATFKILLEYGACIEIVNIDGETPLHLAAAEANKEIVEIIFGALYDRKDSTAKIIDYINQRKRDTRTALHLAVATGDSEITNLLLRNGADATVLADDGSSALHFASAAGNGHLVSLLLANGLQVDTRDNQNWTALHRALDAGHMEAARVLVNNNANVNARDEQGLTPLLSAVIKDDVKFIAFLLQLGASPEAQDINLKNSLHYAAENGNAEAAQLLLDAKKNIQHDVDVENQSPIHYAAKFGHVNVLKLCASRTMQLKETDLYGNTPLHLAAQAGNVSCIDILASDFFIGLTNYPNKDKQTPLHVAIINEQVQACKALLKCGADMNCQDRQKWTPLHYASLQESSEILRTLMETDVDIDCLDDHLKTPLVVAAEKGNVQNVMILLEKGAVCKLCDDDGNNFFEIALENRKTEVCRAVLESDRWEEVLSSRGKNGCNFMERLIQLCPDVAEIILDRSTTFSDHHPEHSDFSVTYNYTFLEEDPSSQSIISDARSILKGQRNDLYFAPRIMAEYGQESLMAHPITSSLFRVKWTHLCRHAYYLSFLIYGLFVVSLSTLTVLREIRTTQFFMRHSQLNQTADASYGSNNQPTFSTFGHVLAYFILVFCALQIVKEVSQLLVLRWRYFLCVTNYIEILLYGGTLYFVIKSSASTVVDSKLRQFGITSVFLGWANTLLFLQRIPMFRLYIVMFLKVCLTIVKLLLVFSIIIGAFSITFYLLFARQKSFFPLPVSVLKVLVMMTGEFEFDEAITSKVGKKDPKSMMYVPYPALSYAVFIIFVFLVAVAFTNLLIGLAVGDIETVRKLATVSIFEQQLELIDTLQGIIPKYFLKRFVYVTSKTVLVNKQTRWQRFMSTITSDTTAEDLKKLRAKQIESENKRILVQPLRGKERNKNGIRQTESS